MSPHTLVCFTGESHTEDLYARQILAWRMENIPISTVATLGGLNYIILPTTTAMHPGTFSLATTAFKPLAVITTATMNKSNGTPPLKPAKKHREEQEDILRCKRRLDFASLGLHQLQRTPGASVSRRNERERNRVKLINNTFARLREHVPAGLIPETGPTKTKNKKLSKVDTLRGAIDYIKGLKQLLDESDAVDAAFEAGYISPTLSPSDSLDLPSPSGSAASEPTLEPERMSLSPEEADLLDFTSWFL